jgi:DNA-binding NtrC family response regulator
VTLATQVANADVPVLITGPNGCGKEKFAEIIQANAFCKDGPFVKVNAGALPKELMESELFGANEGAYTGARKDRIGRFERAHEGTLFLDEIGNLPVEGQVKLLRVIQTGEFERLGSSETQKVKVRLICATNTPLQEAVDRQEFRQDLLYRINVIQLAIPPLSERPDDILPLAQSFLGAEKTLSTDAKKALLSYHWPGNIRELQNALQRATLLSPTPLITPEDLGLPIDASALAVRPLTEMTSEISSEEIRQVLDEHKGVIARAARDLGMSRQALYRRIKKFGIEHE